MHAFLSPSKSSWVNYDFDKLERVFMTHMTARRGTELHALAHDLIRLGVRLPDNGQTLSMYVNDAIGFRMKSEQTLFYSENCYGHADTISFRENFLRIHDLKNGVIPASPMQLNIYAAIFCLEYKIKPSSIKIETRIYQNDAVEVFAPDAVDIVPIMDRIVTFDEYITKLRREIA